MSSQQITCLVNIQECFHIQGIVYPWNKKPCNILLTTWGERQDNHTLSQYLCPFILPSPKCVCGSIAYTCPITPSQPQVCFLTLSAAKHLQIWHHIQSLPSALTTCEEILDSGKPNVLLATNCLGGCFFRVSGCVAYLKWLDVAYGVKWTFSECQEISQTFSLLACQLYAPSKFTGSGILCFSKVWDCDNPINTIKEK